MPRAKPYSDADNEPPTHLGDAPSSPWEDEASTTVEQGEVAEKVRTLGFAKQGHNTNHTHTGTGVDEPTVDDQHAHGVLSAVTPIRPDNNARLIITAGNDAGQEIEIRPNKTYTIGRGLDNDIVLTDIAVSRKHFDLKFEDGAWIIVDRGSGNGTVVNGNLEDNPFMLASGDTIEIGNTIFRYDQPNGSPREQHGNFDDDEMSTVAGKPLRSDQVIEEPPPAPLPRERPRPERPKTLPPPVPLRAQQPSTPPPLSFAPPAPLPQQPMPLMPASTLPMPQMANRPPLGMGGHNQPTMMGDAMGLPLPPQPQHLNMPMGGGVPSTLPGHSSPQHRPSPSFPYPQAQEIPPHSVHAQMLQIQTQNRRGDGSTAHVPPAPYDPSMYMGGAPQQYLATPNRGLSKRTKLAIAGIGLALLTGIVTAAVVKSGSSSKKAAVSAKDTAKKDAAKDTAKDKKIDKAATKPTAEPIVEPTNAPNTATKIAEVPKDTKDTKAAQEKAAQEAKAQAAADKAAADKAAQEAKAQAAADKAAQEKAEREEKLAQQKAAEEAKRQAAAQKRTTTTAPKRDARRETPVREAPPKRTAVAADTSGARDKADALYRQKKFADAANILAKAASSASDDEAGDLRDRSSKMTLLGKAYAKGMAPGEKPIPAYTELQKAYNFDGTFGGNFRDEITARLGTVAPKAAVAFAAQENYGKAREAYLAAQRAGSTDANLPAVKGKLESYAKELYASAQKEASSNPGPAKEKLKQIRTLVDASSKIARDAQALYNKL